LVGNGAGGFAGGLAGSLALTAAAGLNGRLKVFIGYGFDVLHVFTSRNYLWLFCVGFVVIMLL
jgi:hypothetical protein